MMTEKCKNPQAAQHNAALNRNQELSVNAAEFIPKFSAPLGDWNAHPEAGAQVFQQAPQVFAPNSRPFPPQQQQIPFGQQPQQRPPHYVYQQNRGYGQNSRPELVNQHQNHHPNYSNHQQQPQHMYMMNQQGAPNQMGNNYQGHGGGQGGGQQRGGINNRLNNYNSQNAEPVALEPLPHKQVNFSRTQLFFA